MACGKTLQEAISSVGSLVSVQHQLEERISIAQKTLNRAVFKGFLSALKERNSICKINRDIISCVLRDCFSRAFQKKLQVMPLFTLQNPLSGPFSGCPRQSLPCPPSWAPEHVEHISAAPVYCLHGVFITLRPKQGDLLDLGGSISQG